MTPVCVEPAGRSEHHRVPHTWTSKRVRRRIRPGAVLRTSVGLDFHNGGAHPPTDDRAPEQTLRRGYRIDGQQFDTHASIVPNALTRTSQPRIIHHMMTSSVDELSPSDSDYAVVTKNLKVVRGNRIALDDVSVRIPRGTITGLLGPSGCGKTTLIRAIVGTQIVASGTVTVLGHPAGSPPLRRRVGYVTQAPTIYSDIKVIDNVRYFAALYGIAPSAADEAIRNVGLSDHSDDYSGNLSGGQRTRVSLACALVCQPDLLVLDEPTVGLDPVLRADLWNQFDALARRGTTLLISSHVMDEADHCAELLLMREGRLLARTTPTRLREDTGCTSLEQAFLSTIRRTIAAPAD